MKSTALWALSILNVLLLAALLGRGMKPNAAVAQGVAPGVAAAGRPGDYIIIPVDFPGAGVGSVVVLDNVSGQLSAVQTDESSHRMVALPRVNIADVFARDADRGAKPRR